MKFLSTILALILGQILFGQIKPMTYTNHGKAYAAFGNDSFYSSKIHEITLNPDSTFEFWSRPNVSCFTWHQYKGTWIKGKDTIVFSDQYEIVENDVRTNYKRDSNKMFRIYFKTDKNSNLKNKEIKVQYIYDYNAHLKDSETIFNFITDSILEIPFASIPNLVQLAALRIEYQLDFYKKRYSYLTENKTLNVKEDAIPNIISVEFVEDPKKEMVYRKIKGIIHNDTLIIFSKIKTKTVLPDYFRDIEFEDNYALRK